jgi:plastocyanin
MVRRAPVLPRILSATLVVLAFATFAACGGSSKASEPTKTAANGAVTVNAFDIHFDVGEIKAPPGPLKVTLVNHGAIEHDFKINGTDMHLKASGGKTTSGTVTLAKGTYDFECTVPGHAAQGMKGTVVVS